MSSSDVPATAIEDLDKQVKVLRRQRDPQKRQRIRSEIVTAALPLADRVARHYRNRSEPLDDLQQVARLGLIKAVDGFDPYRGRPFTSYAVPTIAGEVKRYFRDKGWTIRPPRRLQETVLRIRAVRGELEQRLGATASIGDLARELGVGSEQIDKALRADRCYSLDSLPPPHGEDAHVSTNVALGSEDPHLAAAEAAATLSVLTRDEPYQYRRILYLRYFLDFTQDQIATEVGVSQMQISRVLSGTLKRMRERAQPIATDTRLAPTR